MKINVSFIVRSHFATLCDAGAGKLMTSDLMLFYGLPGLGVPAVWWLGVELSENFYIASIGFFGVFVALMLNMQVAIFGIHGRKWNDKIDSRSEEIKRRDLELRRLIIGEINSNISYLTLISCLVLVLSVIALAALLKSPIYSGVVCGLYLHFLLTLLMIIKRLHALFHREFSED
jgi:hypothetical protein